MWEPPPNAPPNELEGYCRSVLTDIGVEPDVVSIPITRIPMNWKAIAVVS